MGMISTESSLKTDRNKMRRSCLLILLPFFILMVIMGGCKVDNTTPPINQEVVLYDTSAITGQLWTDVFYYNETNGTFLSAPQGTMLSLFASYDDIDRWLPLYSLQTTTSYRVYFGYLIYGNYYVVALSTISGKNYEGIGIVQVRPGREELLSLTMYHTQL
jgi:hypothetical protein